MNQEDELFTEAAETCVMHCIEFSDGTGDPPYRKSDLPFPTVHTAVVAWRRLPTIVRRHSWIVTASYKQFKGDEIGRLYAE